MYNHKGQLLYGWSPGGAEISIQLEVGLIYHLCYVHVMFAVSDIPNCKMLRTKFQRSVVESPRS